VNQAGGVMTFGRDGHDGTGFGSAIEDADAVDFG
jgi:hypothetical protein